MRILILILTSMFALLISSENLLSQEKFGHPVNGAATITTGCQFSQQCAGSAGWHHTAVDYTSSNGSTVKAAASGKVSYIIYWTDNDHGMGTTIIIEHKMSNGGYKYSSYSHLNSIDSNIYVGKVVSKGETIGVMGGSGYDSPNYWSTHLHFEIKDGNVISNPYGGGPYWGYTPSDPVSFGYQDPEFYINSLEVIPHPSLTHPSNTAVNIPANLTFDWASISGANNYRIQVKKGSNTGWTAEDGFLNGSGTTSSVVVNQTTGYSSELSTNLTSNETYYWTVRVANPNAHSYYSPPQSFTTSSASYPTPPNTPSLYQPSWNATNVTIPVNFDWSTVSGGAEYRIQVSTSNSGWNPSDGFTPSSYCNATVLVNKNTGTNSSFTWNSPDATYICDSPQENMVYYWTVRSFIDGSGTSDYTLPQMFTTVSPVPPDAPTLYQPSPNEIDVSIPVNFDWSTVSGGAEYRIQVSTSNSGWSPSDGFTPSSYCNATVFVNKNTGTNSSFTWNSPDGPYYICDSPQENTTYYWTVRSFVDGSGTSDYTPPQAFTTEQLSCLSVDYVTDDVYAYESDYQEAGNTLYGSNTIYNNGVAEYRAGNEVILQAGFKALAGSEVSAFIAPCTIPKSDGALPENESIIKKEGEDFIIYPNPANDHLFVSFDAFEDGVVLLEIYDLNGKLVEQINRNVDIGANNLDIDIQGLNNGVYIIQLNDGQRTQSSKILIQ